MSVSQLGENEERMRFVYSRSELARDLFEELDINFKYRSFGIIPLYEKRGGGVVLERLQRLIPSIETETKLMDFTPTNLGYKVCLRKNGRIFEVESRHLVLATGGYSGTFKYTDNVRYKDYNVFDIVRKNGGSIVNLDCIFVHPFGYNQGRRILIGNESKRGEFVDAEGNFVFDKETRQLIKDNNYHEIFNTLLEQMDSCRRKGSNVYFVDADRKIEIVPTTHYTAGGIKTNHMGEVAGCRNLFAIGECGADGSRNGGRFPGYAFTAAIVYGKVLGDKFSPERYY